MSLVGHIPFPGIECNDIWAYVDSSGTEYALVGTTHGTAIVSLLDPAVPDIKFFIPGPISTWREIKTYEGFAYVTNESSGGLMIIDLRNLPTSIDTLRWSGTIGLETAHNIFIDENGIAYTLGSNLASGADFLDLKPDPWNPTPIGEYNLRYIHDCFVRGDTMWAAEINNGQFSVVDVSDKSDPKVLATQSTPHNFSHHVWPSDDNSLLFNLDERPGAWLAAYDVSDLDNIKEVDRYQSSPGSSVIPHNSFFLDDFQIISYYKDGIVAVDVSRPSNIVRVGNYDTSPLSGSGFSGSWGVYPYLPSGLIIASDIEEGLFVIEATLNRACYLEGTIKEISTGAVLNEVHCEILNADIGLSNVLGQYKLGTPTAGTYDVKFYSEDCFTQIESDVALANGEVTERDVYMDCPGLKTGDQFDKNGVYFQATPNISSGPISISYLIRDNFDGATFELFDAAGKLLKQYQLSTFAGKIILNSDLAAGSYICRLRARRFDKSLKIIKN